MAAASYTTDLTDWIADGDTTAWTELTNATSGGAPDEADTESALQGTNACSQITNTTALCSLIRILGAPVTITSGNVFLVWHGHGVATALDSYANGGLRVAVVGSTVGNWKAWAVGGNDVPPFPYSKWTCTPVDPTVAADYTLGTPPTGGTDIYGVGSMCILTQAVARGQPHICDIIRYGRAEARIHSGDLANGYATFAGFAAQNDTTTNRWGLIQGTTGGFLWKGLLTLGYSAVVDFRDSNVAVFIQDCRKVSSTFNKIEIRQAGSRVDWTNVSFTNVSPSTGASKGALEVIDDADVNIDACTFTDMDSLIFKSNSTILNSTFRRTGQITTGGATLTNCTIDSNSAASAVLANSPANAEKVSGCSFTSDGTGNGIEITGTAANMTLTDCTFSSGYTGTSTDAAIYVNIATGSMNLTIAGSGTDITGKVRTAGCVVTVVVGARTVKAVAVDADGVAVTGAFAYLRATAGGNLPSDAAITSITRSGTTATVTFSAPHNLLSNDKVLFSGITDKIEDNVIQTVTNTGATTVTFATTNAGSTAYTGTKVGTFIFLSGLANAGAGSNELSMSRSIPATQPVSGWVRKSSTIGQRYKQGSLAGSVSTSQDTTVTGVLISDE